MILLGTTGFARSGKDSFCKIAKKVLIDAGYKVKIYSFASALKREVEPFLKDVCGVDVWTNDTEIKTDIRDFLVWYGTTFWRKRDPERWVRNTDKQIRLESHLYDVSIISDVRYWNEADWIHTIDAPITDGWLVHISSYTVPKRLSKNIKYDKNGNIDNNIDVDDCIEFRQYDKAPNEQERINDPLMQEESNYRLEWEKQGIKNQDEVLSNTYLIDKVTECLKNCPYLTIPKQ